MKTLSLALILSFTSFSAFSADYLCYSVTGKGKTAGLPSAHLSIEQDAAKITSLVNVSSPIEFPASTRSAASSQRTGSWVVWSKTDSESAQTIRLSSRLLSEDVKKGKTFLTVTDADGVTHLKSWAWVCEKAD
jgi:hypothetical protein